MGNCWRHPQVGTICTTIAMRLPSSQPKSVCNHELWRARVEQIGSWIRIYLWPITATRLITCISSHTEHKQRPANDYDMHFPRPLNRLPYLVPALNQILLQMFYYCFRPAGLPRLFIRLEKRGGNRKPTHKYTMDSERHATCDTRCAALKIPEILVNSIRTD